ncbi:acetyltransferase [Flavobacterium sp. 83]|jgi:sugar O-acyltransferase (sialic acid O-acetyltransferase NeuD family)|uniref:acetyltransferase n=1 Tax=Flavobacterium sp. 83 TaxID=1131812 RepID=UPI00068F959A|nr:acetyltransferase [Flavobacterium sp. 83]
MENKKLYIFGASGHGKVVAELIQSTNFKIEAIFDDEPKNDNLDSIPIINSLKMVKPTLNKALVIAIGNNLIRKQISLRFNDFEFFTSIHKTAIVSPSATVDIGTVIMINAVINSDAKIGKHVIINTAAVIEHNCTIADFVHISPKVTLSGSVSVGLGTHIGSGVIVIPGIKIGKWCTVGAGAVIIKDIPDGATVIGNPGKIIKFAHGYEIEEPNARNSKRQIIKI